MLDYGPRITGCGLRRSARGIAPVQASNERERLRETRQEHRRGRLPRTTAPAKKLGNHAAVTGAKASRRAFWEPCETFCDPQLWRLNGTQFWTFYFRFQVSRVTQLGPNRMCLDDTQNSLLARRLRKLFSEGLCTPSAYFETQTQNN